MTGLSHHPRRLNQRTFYWGLLATAFLAFTTSALAHHGPPGHEDVDEFDMAHSVMSGLLPSATGVAQTGGTSLMLEAAHGFVHPFTGVDHLLLGLAMGWIAYALGRAEGVRLGAFFIACMAAGLAVGSMGFGLPMVSQGVALSVIAAGIAIMASMKKVRQGWPALATLFGFWYGNAHGLDISASMSVPVMGGAMLLAASLLVATGAGLAALCSLHTKPLDRWVGATLVVVGAFCVGGNF